MIRLRQTFGAHAGRVMELHHERIRFGRMPECEVTFDAHADLDASGRHAEIVQRGDDLVLVDAQSRNGTFVNGQRVQEHIVREGDEIEFGLGGPRVVIERIATDSHETRAARPAPRNVATAAATPIGARPVLAPIGEAPTVAADTPQSRPGMAAISPPTPTPSGPASGSGSRPAAFSPPAPTPSNRPSGPLSEPYYGGGPPAGPPPGPAAAAPIGPAGTLASPSASPRPAPLAPLPSPTPFPGGPSVTPFPMHAPTPPPEVSGERRYGNRTVGMMIQAALASERKSSRFLWIALGCLAALLLVTTVALVVLFLTVWQDPVTTEDPVSPDAGVGEAEVALDPARISADNGEALFLLTAGPEGAAAPASCTAFAVRNNLLATTARCVLSLEAQRLAGHGVRATPNGLATALPVRRMWRHPGFTPDAGSILGPDIGLVEIEGEARAQVRIAPMERLGRLRGEDVLYVFGFTPAAGSAPTAQLWTGLLVRVAMLDGSAGDVGREQLLEHNAPGVAGAPILDAGGQCVGVHTAGGLPGDGSTGPGRGVRADLLVSLLSGLGR